MKTYFVIFTLVLTACAAKNHKEAPLAGINQEAQKLRYRHIQDGEGKILATLDIKEDSIEYKDDPKKVVPLLIAVIDQISAQCQEQVNIAKEESKPKPVDKVHNNKKKK